MKAAHKPVTIKQLVEAILKLRQQRTATSQYYDVYAVDLPPDEQLWLHGRFHVTVDRGVGCISLASQLPATFSSKFNLILLRLDLELSKLP
ncbi:hypothetical protein OC835_006943 [Tilletia horrida]|nr:hypothetical protein OC835_006943 [Tilletia horrida]